MKLCGLFLIFFLAVLATRTFYGPYYEEALKPIANYVYYCRFGDYRLRECWVCLISGLVPYALKIRLNIEQRLRATNLNNRQVSNYPRE